VYLATLTAGAGLVGLLRWYWWRLNAWSEITALTGSFIVANGKLWARPLHAAGIVGADWMARVEWFYSSDTYAIRLLVIVGGCAVLWLGVTFLTRPVSEGHLELFFRRVRPGGWWGPVAAKCPEVARDCARYGWLGWFAGVVCVYTGLFGVGYCCIARPLAGAACLAVSAVSGWFMVSRASSGVGSGATDTPAP